MRPQLLLWLLALTGCATTSSRPAEPAPARPPMHRPAARAARPVAPAPPAPAPVAEVEPPAPEPALPAAPDVPAEEGMASYYADSLAGRRTASGERYRPDEATCAHRTHRFGTRLLVTAAESGRSAECRVNDRGPWVEGRVLDVSKRVARQLGMIGPGLLRVRVVVVEE